MIFIANTIAISLYVLLAGYQAAYLLNHIKQPPKHSLLFTLGGIAVCAHALSAISTIYDGTSIDVGFFRVSSLICWFIAVITLLGLTRRPNSNILAVLFPMAALSILASSISAPVREVRMSISAGIVVHILSSILAYSLLTMSAIQAFGLALQERNLKHHHTGGILRALPPLQTMEKMLFELVWIGVILLSVSILSGVIYIDDIFAQHLVHKTTLSIAAWCMYSVLLWGRHQLGWRSQTAVRWTIGGFFVLMLGYYGSKLVLELILKTS
jgi:ABC-type uncharacterized transport system permease subunit